MSKKIMWASQHLEIDTLHNQLQKEETEEFDEEYFRDDENYIMQKIETENVISTPFGLWRVDDVMNPYKQFKLWMGHTNFTINKAIAYSIKTTPGIEVLSIISRYRFLIGVGEMFDIRDVRVEIEQRLHCTKEQILNIDNSKLKNDIESLKKTLSDYKKWAIYVFPNGHIDFVTDEVGKKDFREKLALYKTAVEHSAGILIESNDD